MAKWMVCALILLQASLLLAEDATTSGESDATSKAEETDAPTRPPSKSSTAMPPLVHNAAKNATEAVKNAAKNATEAAKNLAGNATKSTVEKGKGAAVVSRCYSGFVVVSTVLLSLSAI